MPEDDIIIMTITYTVLFKVLYAMPEDDIVI